MSRAWGKVPPLLFLLVAAFTGVAKADWVNLTGAEVAPNIAEIFVEDDQVRVLLEVFPDDRDAFADLLDGGLGAATLGVTTGNGRTLQPVMRLQEERVRVDRRSPFAGMIDPYSGRRLPEPPADPRVVFAELVYPFQGQRPQSLEFTPPRDAAGNPVAVVGMIVLHRAVPVTDFRFLSDRVSLRLDWDDPWYSAFDQKPLARHHRDPTMVFLYAEPFEVRHEVLLRVREAAELVGLEPAGATLSEAQAADLIKRAADAIAARSALTVDGQGVAAAFRQGAFMQIGVRGLELLDHTAVIDVDAALLGLVWSIPVDGLPDSATLRWEVYREDQGTIPGYAIDTAGPFLTKLTADDPVLTWTNHFTNWTDPRPVPITLDLTDRVPVPMLSALMLVVGAASGFAALRRLRPGRGGWLGASVAAGVVAIAVSGTAVVPIATPLAGPPEKAAAAELVEYLVTNAGAALAQTTDDGFAAALTTFVAKPAADDVGAEIRRGLAASLPSGARARTDAVVDAVADEVTLSDDGGLRLVAGWTALVSGGHWGHLHRRAVRYRALLDVRRTEGVWQLEGLSVLQARVLA